MLLSGVAMAQYPTTGLVAYFPLDDVDAGSDVGPNGITPSGISFATGQDRHGGVSGAFYFDQTLSYYIEYDMSEYTALKVESDITIAYYAKVLGYANGSTMPTALSISDKIRAGFNVMQVSIVTGLYGAFDRNSGGTTVSTTSSYINGTTAEGWHHYAFVKEGDNLTIYIDGAVVATASGYAQDVPFTVNDVSMVIGQNQYLANGGFRGWLDDMFIYDRALTVDELDDLMAIVPCAPITGNLTVDGPTSLCAEGQATYTIQIGQQNATEYFWEYYGGTGTLTNGSVTITAPAEGEGNPTLTIYGSNECSQGSQFTYAPSVVGTPAPFTITGQTLVCVGSGLAYSVESTGIPVTWDFPNGWVQTITFPNNNGGQFTAGESGIISFTRDNGCFTRTETLDVNVVQSAPEPPVLVTGSLYPCYGQQELYAFTFDSTVTSSSIDFSTFSSTWTTVADTDTSRFITPAGWMFGPFNVTATATNICGQTQTSVALTTNSGSLDTYGTFYEENGVLIGGTYTGIITRQWLLEGQPIPGATESTYTPTVSGNYSQQVEFINFNCDAYVSDELYVEVTITGVDEATAQALHLYPNPTTTSFTMDGLIAGSTITLMDAMGRTVSSTAVTAARMEVSVGALSTGIYMVQVMDGNNVRTARLVVNH